MEIVTFISIQPLALVRSRRIRRFFPTYRFNLFTTQCAIGLYNYCETTSIKML